MTARAVLDIDLNDEKFREFYALFREFHGDMDELPESWKEVAAATDDASSHLDDFGVLAETAREHLALMAAQSEIIRKSIHGALESHQKIGESIHSATQAQKAFLESMRQGNAQVEAMGAQFQKLGGGAFGAAHGAVAAAGRLAGGNGLEALSGIITDIGGKLPVIGMVATALGGLAVAAIAAGKKLADDAVGQQREARGIGVTTGQYQAFDLDFARYGDPDLLHRMADAQADMSKIGMLSSVLHKTPQEIMAEKPDQLAIEFHEKEREWMKNTPPEMRNIQVWNGMGFGMFDTFEGGRQADAETDSEEAKFLANYARNSKEFDVKDANIDKEYDLSRGIDEATIRAKTGIQDSDDLASLAEGAAGGLKNLEDSVTGATSAIRDFRKGLIDGLHGDPKPGKDGHAGKDGTPGNPGPAGKPGKPGSDLHNPYRPDGKTEVDLGTTQGAGRAIGGVIRAFESPGKFEKTGDFRWSDVLSESKTAGKNLYNYFEKNPDGRRFAQVSGWLTNPAGSAGEMAAEYFADKLSPEKRAAAQHLAKASALPPGAKELHAQSALTPEQKKAGMEMARISGVHVDKDMPALLHGAGGKISDERIASFIRQYPELSRLSGGRGDQICTGNTG